MKQTFENKVAVVTGGASGIGLCLCEEMLALGARAVVVADNTWGSGYIYRPLGLGADVSVIAATKYVGGHSDLMLGAAVSSDPALIGRLHETHYALGNTVSADDAWLGGINFFIKGIEGQIPTAG